MSLSGSVKLLSRRKIESLIADGATLIIVDGYVLKLDAWLPYHPGGHKPIQHMVGRDASDEVKIFHGADTYSQMSRYRIGKIQGRWKNFIPPIQGGVFRKLDDGAQELTETVHVATLAQASSPGHRHRYDNGASSKPPIMAASSTNQASEFLGAQSQRELEADLAKYPSLDEETQTEIMRQYRVLYRRIEDEGLFICSYWGLAWDIVKCMVLFGIMLLLVRAGWYTVGGLFVGFMWTQLAFIAHDAGHQGITHKYTIDSLIGLIITAPIVGISLGWWKGTHNVHHIVTNSPEHDPDNQHMPVFTVNHRFLDHLYSTYHERTMRHDCIAKTMVRYQTYLYYPVLAFGRFNLYFQSLYFLAMGLGPRKGPSWWHRWFEIVGTIVFWLWYGYGIVYKSIPTVLGRIGFILASHMINGPLHVQLTVSHYAMSKVDLGPTECFAQMVLRTTMDVDCPAWMDFFHGGLHFQVIHHLFPRVPRHNLRRAQKLVKEFCKSVDIPYTLHSVAESNKEVLGCLAEVSRQAAVLAECHRAMAREGLYHGH